MADMAVQEQATTGQTPAGGSPPPESASPVAEASDASRTPPPERPQIVPEEFWDAEAGPKFDDIFGQFNELKAFKASRDSELAQVPDDPAGYEIGLPEGFKVPDGYTFELDPDDPIVGPARDFAKKHNLTPDGFKEMVGLLGAYQIAEHEQMQAAQEAEREKLGTKAVQRIDAVTRGLEARLGKEMAGALLPMLFTAKQVQAFEKLIAAQPAGFNAAGREATSKPELSDEEWDRMSSAQKIEWRRKNYPDERRKG